MKSTTFALLIIAFIFLKGNESMNYNKLTPLEEQVIIHKGTERPFSGKYYKHDKSGTYLCKRCNAPLYHSDDKFDSGCGWPSFEDEIENAVKRIPDVDGIRTEIVCANCGAHLGHIFLGEGFTDKNTRHCVNSLSLNFIEEVSPETQRAIFAGGCFWGVEYHFQKLDGVLQVISGYIGGKTENPTYKEVCSGSTGFAEAVEITFDPEIVSYEKLVKLFFEIHDFTQINRQGPDIGEQYRSAIFYLDEGQKKTANKIIKQLLKMDYDVATTLGKAEKFYPAEDYHQDYYLKTGKYPYCHSYRKIFD